MKVRVQVRVKGGGESKITEYDPTMNSVRGSRASSASTMRCIIESDSGCGGKSHRGEAYVVSR